MKTIFLSGLIFVSIIATGNAQNTIRSAQLLDELLIIVGVVNGDPIHSIQELSRYPSIAVTVEERVVPIWNEVVKKHNLQIIAARIAPNTIFTSTYNYQMSLLNTMMIHAEMMNEVRGASVFLMVSQNNIITLFDGTVLGNARPSVNTLVIPMSNYRVDGLNRIDNRSSTHTSYAPTENKSYNFSDFIVGYNYSYKMPVGFTIGVFGLYTYWSFNFSTLFDGVSSGKPEGNYTGEISVDGFEFTAGYSFKLIKNRLRLPIGIGMSMTDEYRQYEYSGEKMWYGSGNLEDKNLLLKQDFK